MKKLLISFKISRILLGLIFLVFGVMGLLQSLGIELMPSPEVNIEMQLVMKGFEATGYLLILVKLIEMIAGFFLLTNRYLNLAIVLLGPIVVNIFFIHLFVDRNGLPIAILVLVLWAVLLFVRRKSFKSFLMSNE